MIKQPLNMKRSNKILKIHPANFIIHPTQTLREKMGLDEYETISIISSISKPFLRMRDP